jgi:hypothetical protein
MIMIGQSPQVGVDRQRFGSGLAAAHRAEPRPADAERDGKPGEAGLLLGVALRCDRGLGLRFALLPAGIGGAGSTSQWDIST